MGKSRHVITLSPEEVRKTPVTELRKKYVALAEQYGKIMNREVLYCPDCDDFKGTYEFYADARHPSGYFPTCKNCLKMQALDYDRKTDTYKDNRKKTIEVFRKLDLPFVDGIYEKGLQEVRDGENSASGSPKGTAFHYTLVAVKSLPQYKGKAFINSTMSDTDIYVDDENRVARPDVKRIFGEGMTEADYLFLQDEYDDWMQRTPVDSKAQETIIIQLCFNQLNLWKAQKAGRDTKNLIDSFNSLLDSGHLKPKQNAGNAVADTLTFGQLIEKWENEKPIPEPDPEFRDVDNIGKYVRVWFFGHLCKAMGIRNAYSEEYDEEIKKYTVERPDESEDSETMEIYERMFGSVEKNR